MRLSFEFFPPKTDNGRHKLVTVADRLGELEPTFFSVTYGAGGSTRDRTFETVSAVRQRGHVVAPHLSMGSDPRRSVEKLLDGYAGIGVERIVALRGDVPSGMGTSRSVRYAAELVRLIRAHAGDRFHIEVAAYPEVHPDAPSPEADLAFFREKVAAGADSAITQYFYNADAYFDFVERARSSGIEVPIVAGVMPITNYAGLVRFSANCGAEIPRWITKRMDAFKDDEESLRRFGIDVVTALCRRLVDGGAPGLHFYTLNQAGPTIEIWRNLSL